MDLVRIYRNVNKDCYSVQTKQGSSWKIISHESEVLLKYARFKVSASGRQRVLETKTKNVHAFVYGYITNWQEFERLIDNYDDLVDIHYNPYKYTSFIEYIDRKQINTARFVVGQSSGQLTAFGLNEQGVKYDYLQSNQKRTI